MSSFFLYILRLRIWYQRSFKCFFFLFIYPNVLFLNQLLYLRVKYFNNYIFSNIYIYVLIKTRKDLASCKTETGIVRDRGLHGPENCDPTQGDIKLVQARNPEFAGLQYVIWHQVYAIDIFKRGKEISLIKIVLITKYTYFSLLDFFFFRLERLSHVFKINNDLVIVLVMFSR